MFWIILDSIEDNTNLGTDRILLCYIIIFVHEFWSNDCHFSTVGLNPTDPTSLNFLKELQFLNKYFEFEGTYTAVIVIILFTFSSTEKKRQNTLSLKSLINNFVYRQAMATDHRFS